MSALERPDRAASYLAAAGYPLTAPRALFNALLAPANPSATDAKPEKKPKRESLDKEVQAILDSQGENIKAPPIRVEVALIQHATEQDVALMTQGVRSADIVIPEDVGASRTSLALFQDIADGVVSPEEVAEKYYFDEFYLAFLVALYKSGARIAHVDAKRGEPITDELRQNNEQVGLLLGPIIRQEVPFEQACTDITHAAGLHAEMIIRRRNEHMLDNLAPAVAAVVRANPQLQYPNRNRKKPLKVFMWMGSAHDAVPKELKRSGTKVKAAVSPAGARKYWDHTTEFHHRASEGKKPEANTGKKLLLEDIFGRLYGFLEPHLKDDDPFAPLAEIGLTGVSQRIFADVFFADAESIYTNCPPELNSSLRNLPTVRQVILDFYNGLIQKKRGKIETKVRILVRQFKWEKFQFAKKK